MILVNGQEKEAVSVFDRGLSYGDGFFETCLFYKGVVQNWSYHWLRMKKSAELLQLNLPDQSVFFDDFARIYKNNEFGEPCVLKIVLTRGVGGRGYSPANCHMPSRIVYTDSFPDYRDIKEKGMSVSVLKSTLPPEGAVAGLKHLNRITQVLAKMELEACGGQEGVVCNDRGYVREGVSSNLFCVKDKKVWTPKINDCGVAGVLRNKVIDVAPKNKVSVEIKNFTVEELLTCDEVFFTNSLMGVCPVKNIENKLYEVGEITQFFISLSLEFDG